MKISIIIPIYNSEKYLRQCLNSVQSQTFADFEVLLINDGSNDNSGKICDEYAANDARLKVFHKENGGVSSARNLGIDEATGDWICFVDSDDTILKDYLGKLLQESESENGDVDLVIQGFLKIKGIHKKKVDLGNAVIESNNYEKLFNEKKIQNFGFPFSKLFNRQILIKNHIRFPENYSIAEDLGFLLRYLKFCKKIKFQSAHNYQYFQNENSLSNRLREPVIYHNRYNDIKNVLQEYYTEMYNDIFFASDKKYFSFSINVGSSLFQMILSMYFFPISKNERIDNLNNLKNDDLMLLGYYKERFRNPIFRLGIFLLQNKKNKTADFILKSFFRGRNSLLKLLGKPVHYKFKK